MYVHGIKSNYKTPTFSAVVDVLKSDLYYRTADDNFTGRFAQFTYYQDVGITYNEETNKYDIPCAVGTAVAPAVGIPIPIVNDQRVICDSQSDLGVDAVQLYNDTERLFIDTGRQRKVVLICHSMGCGITRGFLAYAQEMHARDGSRPGADEMVDSVTFLEGAISGSMLAKVGGSIDDLQTFPPGYGQVFNEVYRAAAKLPPLQFDQSRPAAKVLQPGSAYYQWARQEFSPTAPGVRYTPPLPYFTVYGDIRLQEQACLLTSCRTLDTTPVGDLVMFPGTPSAYDPAPVGGGRFLLDGARGGQNWEWGMRRDIPFYAIPPLPIAAGGPISLANAIGLAAVAPENHLRFGDTSAEVMIQDCCTGGSVSVATQLLRILRGQLYGQPYVCQP